MIDLNELEVDALKEIFNIGVGYAADSLSRMVNEEVNLSIPEINIVCSAERISELNPQAMASYCAVTQRFSGDLNADAVLMFPGEKSLELVRLMVGEVVPVEEMSDLEQEALTEVGNILLNSCVSVISDTLGSQFECSMPRYLSGRWEELLPASSDDDCLLVLNIDFLIERREIHGYLMFFMKMASLEGFKNAILKHLGLVTQ